MKVIRFILIGFLVILGLVVIAVGVASTSRFQTWAVQKALAKQPDFVGTVGRVDAGFNRVQMDELSVKTGRFSLVFPSVEVELPVISALCGNVKIRKLVTRGWTLDLTKPVGVAEVHRGLSPEFSLLATAYGAESPPIGKTMFQGILSQLKLPVDLSVEAAELEGELVLPAISGQPPVRTKMAITGGQLGAGRDGTFSFNSVVTLAPAAPVNTILAAGTLTVAMDTARTFSRLGVDLKADAGGPQFPTGTKLGLSGSAARANAGESYTLVIEGSARKLVTIQAGYAGSGTGAADLSLTGTWMLDATAADVAPFSLGRALPDFVAKGEGKFTADCAFKTFSASGRLEATVDRLETLRPELIAVGAAKLGAEFDVVSSGAIIRVTSLVAELAGSTPVLSLRALQPFEFNASSGELKIAEPAKDLLKLDLQGLPLGWVQPFVKDFTFSGDDVRGAFMVGARNAGFAVRPVTALSLGNFSVTKSGQAWFRGIDASLKFAADYTPQGWQAEIAEGAVRNGSVNVFTLDARAGQLSGKDQPIKLAGQWAANIPAVTAQPLAARYASLTAGQATGDFVASVGIKRELQAKLAVRGLSLDPRTATLILPAIQADIRADVDAAGTISLSVPLILERETRKSDLTLTGTVAPHGSAWEVDGRLTSTYLAAEDAQVLGAPLAGSALPRAPSETSPLPPAARDPMPIWSGVSGKITLALKKVVYQQKFEVNDLGGTLQIDAGSVRLENLRAGLGEGSDLRLGGAVTFDGKAKEPYVLKGDLTLVNFDTVPLFRALDPGKPATVEGKFNATSQFAGTGLNLPQLLEHTRGDLQLTSKSGVSRLLSADVSDKIQKASSTLSALGGLLGSVTGKEKMADFANKGQIVADIATALKEVPYDQLNVAVTRGLDLNFNLKNFTLIAPEVRLTGTGEIRHDEGVPVLAQPLDLKLQLGTRGKLADLMTRASLVDGTQDNLGYAGFISLLRIGGTVENPDTSDIRNVLIKAAAGGSLLNKLGL